jgi:hypothetical protein
VLGKHALCREPAGRHSAKEYSFPRAKRVALGQGNGQHSITWSDASPRVVNFAESWFLAKIQLCRESFFAEGRALSIQHVAKRFPSPRVTLCRDRLCRVPDIWRSAKKFSLGEEPVSGSDLSSTVMWHITFYSSLHSCSDLSITEDHEHSRNGGWSLIWMVAPQ